MPSSAQRRKDDIASGGNVKIQIPLIPHFPKGDFKPFPLKRGEGIFPEGETILLND